MEWPCIAQPSLPLPFSPCSSQASDSAPSVHEPLSWHLKWGGPVSQAQPYPSLSWG